MFHLDNDKAYRACCCCHVRTGTILLGVWHMFVHMLVLSVIGVVLLHPDIMQQYTTQQLSEEQHIDYAESLIPPFTRISNETPRMTDMMHDNTMQRRMMQPYQYYFRQWSTQDVHLALVLTGCTFFIVTLMVYGALKGHPGYLMPFFCLQVFDFCVTILSIVCSASYLPYIKKQLLDCPDFPFRDQLVDLDDQYFLILVVICCALIITIKAYLIGMVWSCYRYLVQRKMLLKQNDGVIHYTDTDEEVLLPPNYDDVIEMKKGEAPPPAYTAY